MVDKLGPEKREKYWGPVKSTGWAFPSCQEKTIPQKVGLSKNGSANQRRAGWNPKTGIDVRCPGVGDEHHCQEPRGNACGCKGEGRGVRVGCEWGWGLGPCAMVWGGRNPCCQLTSGEHDGNEQKKRGKKVVIPRSQENPKGRNGVTKGVFSRGTDKLTDERKNRGGAKKKLSRGKKKISWSKKTKGNGVQMSS